MSELESEESSRLITVPLLDTEMLSAIDILNFASQAAAMLASKEVGKNATEHAKRYNRMSLNALELATLLRQHLDIGEPEDGKIH